ncbi:NAD-dependent epimerase/dehydratase family protein [Flammeovirga sp. EKP202]|uniref:NAD-dependent epimerase/dehydratase family protein n=1 Tax=Flammeovirga sp. EKP202 TaxID=2770592 RepID=UPI00165EE112|nr:NAD-dependent epimerase/dehydratase family protein [Flammeovirga sp. EKP202]MBD0401056.1 NAD-dependent epimerase/dehydratase family protein [Flammeovirga sp. EKP202]
MIALTGASGHVGYVLHKYLQKENIPHRVLVRKRTNRLTNVEQIVGDLRYQHSLQQFVNKVDTVIHSAAVVYPKYGVNEDVINVNYIYSKNLFEIAKKAGVKHFIFISSIHSMEVPITGVFDETAALVKDENRSYDYSKAQMERYLSQQSGIKITILNPTSIIGGGDFYFNGFNQLFRLIHFYRLPMLTQGGFDVVDVKDVVKSCIFAVQHQVEGKYILGNTYYSIPEIAKIYGNIAQKLISPIKLSTPVMKMLATFTDFVGKFSNSPLPTNSYSINALLELNSPISHQKAVNNLDFKPKVIHNSLRDIHKWIENQELILD